MQRILIFALLFVLTGCNLAAESAVTPVPTPDIPFVEILAPANNRQIVAGTEFEIDILARDESAGVARVELYVDGDLLNTSRPLEADAVPVFRTTMNWLAQGVGFHTLEAIAYRADETQGDPALITIEVLPR